MSDLIEILIEDTRWQDLALQQLADRATGATLGYLGLPLEAFEISLLGCDDTQITQLNTQFRSKPAPTNVLSWPSEDRRPKAAGQRPVLPSVAKGQGPTELGDIAIAYQTCAREAHEGNLPLEHHVLHLLVHGILHLLGYDHIEDADADLMQAVEVEILADLGIANPY